MHEKGVQSLLQRRLYASCDQYRRLRASSRELGRNAARRIEPHQTHGATRVHAKHLATEEEKLPKTATGTVASSSLKSRRRVAPRRAASSGAFPLVRFLPSATRTAWSRSYGSRREPTNFPSHLQFHRQREHSEEAVVHRGCNQGLRSHAAEVLFRVIAAANARACNAARQKDYERCNSAGTTAKRRGGPQRCRACARRLLYCCSSPH